MHAPHNDGARKRLRRWWTSPPRSGLRLIIAPWEYRHLRAFAGLRIAGGVGLTGLGLVTLIFGGDDTKTYAWAMALLLAAAAEVAFASWELSIARSRASGA